MQLAVSSCSQKAEAIGPAANPAAVVTEGSARFTVLTPEMIRIEYSDSAIFEDRATFTVSNRYFDTVPRYEVDDDGDYLTITTDAAVTYKTSDF